MLALPAGTAIAADHARITVEKAHFHADPDLGTELRSYLIEDQLFVIEDYQHGFLFGRYTNERQLTTVGWIRLDQAVPFVTSTEHITADRIALEQGDWFPHSAAPYLVRGDEIGVVIERGDWTLVYCAPTHTLGWVPVEAFEEQPAPAPTSLAVEAGRAVSEPVTSGLVRVVASVACFHDKPDQRSERGQYLVEGDLLRIDGFEDGFFHGRFTNSQQLTTVGWIRADKVAPQPKTDAEIVWPKVVMQPIAAMTNGVRPYLVSDDGVGVLLERDAWLLVYFAGSDSTGWVPRDSVKKN